jgi:hypothetical protein
MTIPFMWWTDYTFLDYMMYILLMAFILLGFDFTCEKCLGLCIKC